MFVYDGGHALSFVGCSNITQDRYKQRNKYRETSQQTYLWGLLRLALIKVYCCWHFERFFLHYHILRFHAILTYRVYWLCDDDNKSYQLMYSTNNWSNMLQLWLYIVTNPYKVKIPLVTTDLKFNMHSKSYLPFLSLSCSTTIPLTVLL